MFKWHTSKATTPYPFNLTATDLERLQDLHSDPKFTKFVGLLTEVADWNGERLLAATDHGAARWSQGYITGIRDVINLIPLLIAQAERIDDVQRHAKSSENGARRSDRDSFLGGPWLDVWDRIRR